MSCYLGLDSKKDCRGTPCRSCTANEPSAALEGYPSDIADAARILEDLARWFESPKESRHIVIPVGSPSALLRYMADELRKKNEIRG